jgi:hypothetical protein
MKETIPDGRKEAQRNKAARTESVVRFVLESDAGDPFEIRFHGLGRETLTPKTQPQLGRRGAMTQKAQRPDIIQIALPSALCHGNDMVRIPEAAAAGDALHAIETQARFTRSPSGALEGGIGGHGVDAANRATPPVAREDLVAHISGVGTEAPLMNTIVAAERPPPPGSDLELAPAAQGKTVRAERKIGTMGTTASEGARGKHGSLLRIIADSG